MYVYKKLDLDFYYCILRQILFVRMIKTSLISRRSDSKISRSDLSKDIMKIVRVHTTFGST